MDADSVERVAVLCVGNILLMDEGVGPAIAKKLLDEYRWPANVEVLDAATMGYALVDEFSSHDYLVVVDAVDGTGAAPGTVFTFRPEDMAQNEVWHGAHDTKLPDVLEACALIGATPQVECVGIQVENMSPEQLTVGLTPAVEGALPLACETVLALLWNHGIRGIVHATTDEAVLPPGPQDELEENS